ncbi:MAG: SURF1 family protein [Halioglobus sp.]
MADTGRSLRFEPEWRITLFVLVMVPLMVGLGFWQIQRAKEKSALAQAWEQRRQQPPSSVTTLQGEPAEALAYRPVEFTGRFLQDEYFLLDNRTRAGRFGQEVLGIVEIPGQPLSVIVNRGWLAADPARRALPAVPEVPGTVTLKGYVYVAPGEPYLLAEEAVGSSWPQIVQAVQMEKLMPAVAAVTGDPVFPYPVRLDPGSPGALAADWQVVNVSPAKHRAYAVQWFAMAAVLTLFYLLRCSNIWQLLRPPATDQDRPG